MKNLTMSVDETVLAAVRHYAAGQGSSVNALVREFLGGIATREDRARRARRRLRALSARSSARVGPKSWRREELHER